MYVVRKGLSGEAPLELRSGGREGVNSACLGEELCSSRNSTCEGPKQEQAWFAERSAWPIISIANKGWSYQKQGWRPAGVRSHKTLYVGQ